MKNTYLSEITILGCIILYPEIFACKISELSEDLFADDINRQIFSAIRKVHKQTNTVDTTLMLAECPQDVSANCKERIIECSEKAFKTTPIDEHIWLLLDSAAERYLLTGIESAIAEGNLTPQHIAKLAQTAQEAFSHNCDNGNIYTEYINHMDKPKLSLPTYFGKLDKVTGGLKIGTLTIIGARPSVGKTTFALNIATNIALNGKAVAFFSLEMTRGMVIDKLCSSACNIPYSAFNGSLGKADRDTVQGFLHNSCIQQNLRIFDSVYTVENICSTIASLKPACAVVDYVQITRTMKSYAGESKRLQMDYISSELKSIAKRTGCCVILLSQLKRQDGAGKPTMADLKESGGLEQDGDYIMLLHRPYVMDKAGDHAPEETNLILEKNKFGAVGFFDLHFNGMYQTFIETV